MTLFEYRELYSQKWDIHSNLAASIQSFQTDRKEDSK